MRDRTMVDLCQRCASLVVVAMTESGRKMPVEPAPNGDWVLTPGPGVVPIAKRYSWSLKGDVPPVLVKADGSSIRYQPHFATCQNAARRRRKQ